MKQKLFRSSDFCQMLFDVHPHGLLVVDEQGRIVASNRALAFAIGAPAESLVGQEPAAALGCPQASGGESCGVLRRCDGCRVGRLLEGGRGRPPSPLSRALAAMAGGTSFAHRVPPLRGEPLEIANRRLGLLVFEDLGALLRPKDWAPGELAIVGRDPKLLELLAGVREVAPTDVPILIQGESGTGKELVAQAIHAGSRRASRPLVSVNCGALPDGLLESELFGHVRGAFTGAVRDKKGRFELADRGTIFLDEIGELSVALQVKLLRALQDGSFERVGGEQTLRVDARVISATNRDLRADVRSGRFRADLYYRLCVASFTMPPLRERRGDIPEIAEHLLERAARELQMTPARLAPSAREALCAYSWPGNVRELDNVLRLALIRARHGFIGPADLPEWLNAPAASRRAANGTDRSSIEEALAQSGGNRIEAARLLGISRATLYRRLAEL